MADFSGFVATPSKALAIPSRSLRPALIGLLAAMIAGFWCPADTRAEANLKRPVSRVILTIKGQIEVTNDAGAAEFDRGMLNDLRQVRVRTSTPWTEGMVNFQGVLVREVLKRVGAHGKTVTASVINDYAVKIPVSDFRKYEVILAMSQDGKPLQIRSKGPLWIIYPWSERPNLRSETYHNRSVWQLRSITVE